MRLRVGWQFVRQLPDLSFYLFRPLYWPRRIRRAFVVLFPIALPLWLLLLPVSIVASMVRGCWRPIRHFWNQPHRRKTRY
jgi:hypothetical protein